MNNVEQDLDDFVYDLVQEHQLSDLRVADLLRALADEYEGNHTNHQAFIEGLGDRK